jgi:hypothetical protein
LLANLSSSMRTRREVSAPMATPSWARGTLDAGESQYQLTCASDVAKRHTIHIRQIAPFDRQLAGLEAKGL